MPPWCRLIASRKTSKCRRTCAYAPRVTQRVIHRRGAAQVREQDRLFAHHHRFIRRQHLRLEQVAEGLPVRHRRGGQDVVAPGDALQRDRHGERIRVGDVPGVGRVARLADKLVRRAKDVPGPLVAGAFAQPLGLHLRRTQSQPGAVRRPAPRTLFCRRERKLPQHVRLATRAGQAKRLVRYIPHRRVHGELQLHGLVELRVKPDVAHVAMRLTPQPRQAVGHRRPGGAAVGTQYLPAKTQQPGMRRQQQQSQRLPLVHAPAAGQFAGPDMRQLHICRRPQPPGQSFGQGRVAARAAEDRQPVLQDGLVHGRNRQLGQRQARGAGEKLSRVGHGGGHGAVGLRHDDRPRQPAAHALRGVNRLWTRRRVPPLAVSEN